MCKSVCVLSFQINFQQRFFVYILQVEFSSWPSDFLAARLFGSDPVTKSSRSR